jgi:hypothetical protein
VQRRVARHIGCEGNELRLGLRGRALAHQELGQLEADLAAVPVRCSLPRPLDRVPVVVGCARHVPGAPGEPRELEVDHAVAWGALAKREQVRARFGVPSGRRKCLRQAQPPRTRRGEAHGRSQLVDRRCRMPVPQRAFTTPRRLRGKALLFGSVRARRERRQRESGYQEEEQGEQHTGALRPPEPGTKIGQDSRAGGWDHPLILA